MTEPLSLSALAVAWLCERAAALGGKLVRDGLNAAEQKLFDWIKARVEARGQDDVEALETICDAPDNSDECDAVRVALNRALKANPADEAALSALLEAAAPEQDFSKASQTAVAGDGAVVVQIQGKDNSVSGINTSAPRPESTSRKTSES